MHPVGTPILLVGPTTPVGRELLLRLAVVGFEVVAYLPDGDDGHTGEFACRLVHDAGDLTLAADAGATIVRVNADANADANADPVAADGPSVEVTRGATVRRFRHAPTIRDLVDRIRGAGWREWLRDPWAGHALPVVHERDVASTVVDALVHDRPATDIGGPQALAWRDAVLAVLTADDHGRHWRHLLGRWAAPALPLATLAAIARYPRLGRRTLADALARRESAAHHPVAARATGARHSVAESATEPHLTERP